MFWETALSFQQETPTKCVRALEMFSFDVIDTFFPIHHLLFGGGMRRGSFLKMPACISWAAGDRERGMVSLFGLGLSKRRSRNSPSGFGDHRINKRMEVQMNQVSPPFYPSRSKPGDSNFKNAMGYCIIPSPHLNLWGKMGKSSLIFNEDQPWIRQHTRPRDLWGEDS